MLGLSYCQKGDPKKGDIREETLPFLAAPSSGTWRPTSKGVRVVQSTGARVLGTEQGGKMGRMEWGLKKN